MLALASLRLVAQYFKLSCHCLRSLPLHVQICEFATQGGRQIAAFARFSTTLVGLLQNGATCLSGGFGLRKVFLDFVQPSLFRLHSGWLPSRFKRLSQLLFKRRTTAARHLRAERSAQILQHPARHLIEWQFPMSRPQHCQQSRLVPPAAAHHFANGIVSLPALVSDHPGTAVFAFEPRHSFADELLGEPVVLASVFELKRDPRRTAGSPRRKVRCSGRRMHVE